jgi:hypothetical protein
MGNIFVFMNYMCKFEGIEKKSIHLIFIHSILFFFFLTLLSELQLSSYPDWTSPSWCSRAVKPHLWNIPYP